MKPPPPLLVRYGYTLLLVAIATAVRWLLDPVLVGQAPFAFHFVAVAAAGLLGGLGPGLASVALSTAVVTTLFIPPRGELSEKGAGGWLAAGVFALTAGGIAALAAAARAARRRAEAAEADTGRLAAIVASSDDAVVSKTLAGVIETWNAGAERLFGYTAAEAIGRPITLIVPPDRLAEEADVLARVGRGEGVNHLETVRLAKGGRAVDVSVTVSPVRDAAGRVVGASKVARDVTDRKRGERDAAERVGLLRLTAEVGAALTDESDLRAALQRCAEAVVRHLDAAFARVWTLDPAGGVLELRASAGLYTHLDGPHGRVRVGDFKIGRIARDRAPHLSNAVPDDPEVSDRAWATREGMVAFAGYPLLVGDDLVGVLAAFARRPLTAAALDGLASIARGVALGVRQRQAVAAQAEALAYAEAIVRTVREPLAVLDASLRVRSVNLAFAQAFRVRKEDIAGHPVEDLWGGGWEAAGLLARLAELLRAGGPVEGYEVRAEVPGIGPRTLSLDGRRLRQEGGRADAVLLGVTDVTDRAAETAARRRADAALMAGEVGTYYWDIPADRVTGDRNFAAAFGVLTDARRSAPLGEFLAAVHPDDRDRLGVEIRRTLDTDAPFQIEYRVAGPAGERWVLARGTVERDAAGAAVGWAGAVVDVTGRKRAEERLRDSEQRYRTLFDSMDEGYCVIEVVFEAGRAVDYVFLEVNPAFEKITELRGVLGRSARQVMPDLEEFWFDTYGRVARTGEPTRFEHDVAPLGGRRFDVYVFRLGGPDGRQVAVLFADITARTRAEVALRSREAELNRLLVLEEERTAVLWQVAALSRSVNASHSAESIVRFVAEDARAVLAANAAAIHLTAGVLSGDALGAVAVVPPQAAWPADDPRPEFAGLLAEVMRTNTALRLTQAALIAHPRYAAPTAGGPPLRGLLAVPLTDHGGRNIGYFLAADKATAGEFTDVDELVLAQVAAVAAVGLENARLYGQLREQDRRKNEFLAMLAHELRNPLAPIRNGLFFLGRTPDPAAAAPVRAMMERQVDQLVHLVDDLLDVSRVTSGKIVLRTEPVDLRAAAEQALETSRPVVEASHHALTVDLGGEPLYAEADANRIAQVVTNLVNNAAKYTPPGGAIRVTAGRDGGEAVLTVADTGVGLPADMLTTVFELFTQVDTSLERSQGGLGLGLPLVKRLVEMHGGAVTATSGGPGRGSTFTVRLPLAAGPAPEPRPPAAISSGPPAARRVLVVDDNVDAAESLGMVLMLEGHAVRLAHDGPGGLAAAADFQPEVAFLDIGLPGMTGYEVARRMRAAAAGWGGVVLVALTGWGTEDDRARAKEAGFDHHLTKPADPERVRSALATRLSTRPGV